eukprot:241878_1
MTNNVNIPKLKVSRIKTNYNLPRFTIFANDTKSTNNPQKQMITIPKSNKLLNRTPLFPFSHKPISNTNNSSHTNPSKKRKLPSFLPLNSSSSIKSKKPKLCFQQNTDINNEKCKDNINNHQNNEYEQITNLLATLKQKQTIQSTQTNKYKTENNRLKIEINNKEKEINRRKQIFEIIKKANKIFLTNHNKLQREMSDLKQEMHVLTSRIDLCEGTVHTCKYCELGLQQINEFIPKLKNGLKKFEEARDKLLENKYKCVSCLDNDKNVSMDGCSHISLCLNCEAQLISKKCPICQATYRNIRIVNF